MNQFFGKDYYDHSCGELPYDDPRWCPFFEQIADHIVRDFAPKTVLDVGCAMGHLVVALRDRGVEAFGIDVSEYAISKVREDIRPFCRVASALEQLPQDLPQYYDLVVTIEVVEHLHEEDCELFINNICRHTDKIIFSSSPDDFWEATHFNVQQPEYWVKRFAREGFFRDLIYDGTYISKQSMFFGREEKDRARVAEDYERHIRHIQKSNEEKNDEQQEAFEKALNHEREQIKNLQVDLERLEVQTRDLSDRNLALEHLVDHEKAHNNALKSNEAILNNKIDRLMTENAAALTRAEHCLSAKQSEIDFLCNQVRQKDTELELIYHSRCYRLILKYYRLKDIIIPRGSRRFIIAKILFRLPRYIKYGYPIKMLRYIKYYGFRGLGKKVRDKVLGTFSQSVTTSEFMKNMSPIVRLTSDFIFTKHTQSVDIIICVHNAYEDVKRCIESVFEFTSFPYHIILVDDGSAEQTRDYLTGISNTCPNISLIRNEIGKGYTFAANAGLKSSTGDYVILLNSDTIVTPDWVDKMIMCCNSQPEIGIVGPLSNTASWQSVPEIFDSDGDWAHNKLPEDYSIEEFAELLCEKSAHTYMNVPLLNGFCLMLSRSTINRIGFFDEETFGKGFGEEDDYNLRALQAGIKLAIADDTFIFHAQSKSYSDEKRLALCRISGQKVRAKHGDQTLDWAVSQMQNNQILLGIRARTKTMIETERLCKSAKSNWEGKSILFILPIGDAGGGGNVVIQEARIMQKMGIDVWLYNLESLRPFFENSYPNLEIPVLYGTQLKDLRKYVERFDAVCSTLYTSVKYTDFKDLINAPKSVYYVQDYEPLFFSKNSLEYQEALESYTIVPDVIRVTKTTWNAREVEMRHHVKCNIIGPSVNIDLFRPYKGIESRSIVKITAMIRPSTPRRAPQLTMEVLREIKLRYGSDVEITVFGADVEHDEGDAKFFRTIQTDFEFKNLGKLNPYEMAALLGDADIFVDFSSFQAMGLTAMEAMSCGCAVILPIEGGTVDFAKDRDNSLMVDTKTKQSCLDALSELIDNPELRERIANQAIVDMCKFAPEFCAFKFLETVFSEVSEKC